MAPFQPGNSHGTGRPRGARNKLARRFLDDLMVEWEQHGAKALGIARREDPIGFCKMVASLVPRELEITTAAAELGDDELQQMIDMLREQLRAAIIELPQPKMIMAQPENLQIIELEKVEKDAH
jgi:hypothetical protein